jgi:hypothetical protein
MNARQVHIPISYFMRNPPNLLFSLDPAVDLDSTCRLTTGFTFHHEERLAARRQAGVEHLGDVGMIHQRRGLTLQFESLQNRARIHASLDELERDLALDRLGLPGDPDYFQCRIWGRRVSRIRNCFSKAARSQARAYF